MSFAAEPSPKRPLVSAIVTTTGRPCALAAVRSALGQTLEDLEVVVVFDGPLDELRLRLPESPRLRLVATGRRRGGGPARTLGTTSARGQFVAFLDDDDTWDSEKLEVQMELVARRASKASHVVVSSRILVLDIAGRPQLLTPTRLIAPNESVADYLFRRRRIRFGEALLHTSTLLCDREIAVCTPWRDLPVHQDWDWILRLTDTDDIQVLMAEQPLTHVAETPGSISRAGNWRGSLEWATDVRDMLSGRQWADLLLCVTAPYAKDSKAPLAALKIGYRALRCGKPGIPALIFFLLYVFGPSRLLVRLVRAVAIRRYVLTAPRNTEC